MPRQNALYLCNILAHGAMLDSRAQMGTIMEATVQCVEEAIVNALVAAETTVGRNSNTAFALPHARLVEILRKYNRLEG